MSGCPQGLGCQVDVGGFELPLLDTQPGFEKQTFIRRALLVRTWPIRRMEQKSEAVMIRVT